LRYVFSEDQGQSTLTYSFVKLYIAYEHSVVQMLQYVIMDKSHILFNSKNF